MLDRRISKGEYLFFLFKLRILNAKETKPSKLGVTRKLLIKYKHVKFPQVLRNSNSVNVFPCALCVLL